MSSAPLLSRRTLLLAAAGLAVAPVAAACGTTRTADTISRGEAYYYDPRRLGPKQSLDVDVCVYGATAGGVAAAVTAARLGHPTTLLAFGEHVGGMTTGGISTADVGDAATIGGIAAEIFELIGAAYGHAGAVYTYQPHVAAGVLDRLLRQAGVHVLRSQPLRGVTRKGTAITELTTETGTTVRAKQYIDASYEGDLLARAGVPWTSGREAAVRWGESLNGYQPAPAGTGFGQRIAAYDVAGRESSGLLYGIGPEALRTSGSADPTPMAYGFRLCITEAADRIPFERPAGYQASDWGLLARCVAAGEWDLLDFRVALPGGGYDLNAYGGISTDAIGLSPAWATAGYARRQKLFDAHKAYTEGLLWFAGHDRSLPSGYREAVNRFGLDRSEWTTTGGWPPELYVREARRMLGEYVATQHDCTGATNVDDPVAVASYKIDSHPCQRMAVGGYATNEGTISYAVRPWPVSMRSLLPPAGTVRNLTVSTCASSSHVAWSSLRMEPVFMMLGQAAASIAALAGDRDTHGVGYGDLAALLQHHGAYLDAGL